MTRILTFIAEVILACVAAFAWTMLAFIAVFFVVIAKVGDFCIKLISKPKPLSYHQHVVAGNERLWETALLVSAVLGIAVLSIRGLWSLIP